MNPLKYDLPRICQGNIEKERKIPLKKLLQILPSPRLPLLLFAFESHNNDRKGKEKLFNMECLKKAEEEEE
jgi:hypothetical protein